MRKPLGFLCLVFVGIFFLQSPLTEAKRKRTFSPPPLKIVDITTSPIPYSPGKGFLEMKVEVELPKNLKRGHLLEVSSLISFPSKRSIRFLSTRQSVAAFSDKRTKPRVYATLWWDGTDQSRRLVAAGTYKYEVRAKLMSNGDQGQRTKMVSLRARGSLKVSSSEAVGSVEPVQESNGEHFLFVPGDNSGEDVKEEESGNQKSEDSPQGGDNETQYPGASTSPLSEAINSHEAGY